MPNLELKFFVSDKAMALIDELRDQEPREKFFRELIELGLCELIESATRMNRDYLMHVIAGQSKDSYRHIRAYQHQCQRRHGKQASNCGDRLYTRCR